MVAKPKRPTVEELIALVAELQEQVRALQAANEGLRAAAFARWDEPVPGETDDERRQRIASDPRVVVHRRPAGPLPPFEPVPGHSQIDVLDPLGRHAVEDDEATGSQ